MNRLFAILATTAAASTLFTTPSTAQPLNSNDPFADRTDEDYAIQPSERSSNYWLYTPDAVNYCTDTDNGNIRSAPNPVTNSVMQYCDLPAPQSATQQQEEQLAESDLLNSIDWSRGR